MPIYLPDDPSAAICCRDRKRLLVAAAISLCLHGGVLAIRSGTVARPSGRQVVRQIEGQHPPAPLTVMLAPYRLTPATARTAAAQTIPPKVDQASFVAENGLDHGTRPTSGNARSNGEMTDLPRSGIPAPVYFDDTDLTRRAEMIEDIDSNPPALEQISGSGKIVATLYIGESGMVDRIEVESAEVGSALRDAVVGELGAIHFTPAEIDGVPVGSRMRIEIVVRPLLKP